MSPVAKNRIQGRALLKPLVSGFRAQIETYDSNTFDNLHTRSTYIEPFWRALGWPIGVQSGITPKHRDVRVNVTLDGLRPDYQFQPYGKVRFFCDAIKPIEDPQSNRSRVYQAKRYAWSWSQKDERAPFFVLTDFEHFRFFKAERVPRRHDPREGLIKEFDLLYTSYMDRFDRLWDVLSRDAVAGGSLNAFLTTDKVNPQTFERAFQPALTWRTALANEVLDAHSTLSEHELNEGTQRILDRLAFIRIMEDRRIERASRFSRCVVRSGLTSSSSICVERWSTAIWNAFKEHFSENLTLSPRFFEPSSTN